MRIAYALKLILVIPLGMQTVRNTTHLLFFQKPSHSRFSHVAITLFWLILPLAVAIPLTDISAIMALVGALCGTHLIFIAPGAMTLKTAPRRTFMTWLINLSLVVFGYCVLVLGVISVVARAVEVSEPDLSCGLMMNNTNSTNTTSAKFFLEFRTHPWDLSDVSDF
jgi:amino acid permease